MRQSWWGREHQTRGVWSNRKRKHADLHLRPGLRHVEGGAKEAHVQARTGSFRSRWFLEFPLRFGENFGRIGQAKVLLKWFIVLFHRPQIDS